jgi:mono/diheme cytochrome c family protein
MRIFLRILKWTGIIAVILILVLVIAGISLYNKEYDAPYPDIQASTDTAIIRHGKHLVYNTAHCIECHYKPGDSLRIVKGEEVPLAGGGFPFEFPGGVFYSRNISSDKETGIGNLSDRQIARALRYGVKSDGTVLIPTMEYQNMSDEDLTAIISYLRSTPPLKHKVPDNEFNLFGKAILAFLLRPEKPVKTPPASVMPDTTVEYGEYIAGSVANCRSCHTERDMNTGEYIGKQLAGGPVLGGASENSKYILVAPNLTPDPATGVMRNWTFEQFKARFRNTGRVIPQTIMPWESYKRMNDTELLAIWKYLQSVEPVHQDNGPGIQFEK